MKREERKIFLTEEEVKTINETLTILENLYLKTKEITEGEFILTDLQTEYIEADAEWLRDTIECLEVLTDALEHEPILEII